MTSISANLDLRPSIAAFDQSNAEDSNWRYVKMYKKNRHTDEIISNAWGKPVSYSYLEEVSTGDLYNDDPLSTVRNKCAAVAFGMPFYTVALIVIKVISIPVHIVFIANKAFQQIAKDWNEKNQLEAIKALILSFVWEIPKTVILDIWTIVKSPFFAIAMFATSLYGVYDPYVGRKLAGKIEYVWHDFTSYRKDFRYGKNTEVDGLCSLFSFKELAEGRMVFIAICFQKLGNSNKQRFIRPENYSPTSKV